MEMICVYNIVINYLGTVLEHFKIRTSDIKKHDKQKIE